MVTGNDIYLSWHNLNNKVLFSLLQIFETNFISMFVIHKMDTFTVGSWCTLISHLPTVPFYFNNPPMWRPNNLQPIMYQETSYTWWKRIVLINKIADYLYYSSVNPNVYVDSHHVREFLNVKQKQCFLIVHNKLVQREFSFQMQSLFGNVWSLTLSRHLF